MTGGHWSREWCWCWVVVVRAGTSMAAQGWIQVARSEEGVDSMSCVRAGYGLALDGPSPSASLMATLRMKSDPQQHHHLNCSYHFPHQGISSRHFSRSWRTAKSAAFGGCGRQLLSGETMPRWGGVCEGGFWFKPQPTPQWDLYLRYYSTLLPTLYVAFWLQPLQKELNCVVSTLVLV